jgi:ribulose-phosphate 3-epimerase
MLKCSTSLWSADLANLERDIKRVEPFSDRFHLDIADGHYVRNMLFFPDQVKAIRGHSALPFEAHLMVTDPVFWLDPFIEAGVDRFIICHDSVPEPRTVLNTIRRLGKPAGISFLITEPVEMVFPFLDDVDSVLVIGTAMGIKGASMDAGVPEKIQRIRKVINERRLNVEIIADGGIRRETVPLLAKVGADYIVPGSLMFREDPATMRDWLKSLD